MDCLKIKCRSKTAVLDEMIFNTSWKLSKTNAASQFELNDDHRVHDEHHGIPLNHEDDGLNFFVLDSVQISCFVLSNALPHLSFEMSS